MWQKFCIGDIFVSERDSYATQIVPPTYENGWIASRWYDLQIYGAYKSRKVAKIHTTLLLNQIKSYFRQVTEKRTPLKYVLYIGHEITVALHLVLTGATGYKCILRSLENEMDEPDCLSSPDGGAGIIFELIDDTAGRSKTWLTKTSYNGRYLDYCKAERKDSHGDFYCTLEEFFETIDTDYTVKYLEDYCPHYKKSIYVLSPGDLIDVTSILMFVCIAFLVFLIIAVALKSRQIKKNIILNLNSALNKAQAKSAG